MQTPSAAHAEQKSGIERKAALRRRQVKMFSPTRKTLPGLPSAQLFSGKLIWVLGAVLSSFLFLATSASATGTYNVFPCSGHAPKGIETELSGTNVFKLHHDCEDPGGGSIELVGEGNNAASSSLHGAAWTFLAPAGAEIKEVSFNEEFRGPWDKTVTDPNRSDRFTHLGWLVTSETSVLEELGDQENTEESAISGPRQFIVGPGHRRFKVELGCVQVACDMDGIRSIATTTAIHVVLADPIPPTIGDPSGTLLAAGPVHGGASLSFPVADGVSGVHLSEVRIDGQREALLPANDNGGQCQQDQPFFTPQPCPTVQTFSHPIDTATLGDDPHHARLVACDAAENCATKEFDFTVENAPIARSLPTIAGTLRPGSKLTSTLAIWEENFTTIHPLTPSYQWLRCSSVTACTPIPGATAPTYALTGADAGDRIAFEETQTVEAAGHAATSATSLLSDPVEDLLTNKAAPSISGNPAVGSKLDLSTGQWEDLGKKQISFASQWLRCPATVTAAAQASQCEAIAGATATSYVPTKADAGKRLLAKVSASTAAPGALSQTAFSAPTSPVTENGAGTGPGGGKAPETKISKHPRKKTSQRKAKFSFSSSQAGSSFQCKLDKGPFKPCRSPFKHKVKPGRHRFSVRAVNSAGVADGSPAVFGWRVS
jgi:hypothetical protein